jgi:peroxiredoxin
MDAAIALDAALLAARLLLAALFAIAALAKLADRAGSRHAMVDFGVPERLATPLAVVLPLAELAVAIALVPARSALSGAVGALVLLLVFMAGIGVNLALGRKPDCHCFGQLSSGPAGWPTLVRNIALAGVAVFVISQGPGASGVEVMGWLAELGAGATVAILASLIGLALVAAEGWAIAELVKQNGRLLVRLEALETRLGMAVAAPPPGLPVGDPAPSFGLPTLEGGTLTLDDLGASRKPVLLVFSDPDCTACTTLLPEIGSLQRDLIAPLSIALISRGSPKANRAKCTEHGLTHVLLQRDHEVAEAYAVNGTPSAVLVRRDGTIGSPLAQGVDEIRSLIARAPTMPAGLRIGDPAPTVRLPDLGGREVDLADSGDRSTLVLFWSPTCGFCQGMLDDLKAWEEHSPTDAPRLLVVSSGSVEANQTMRLRSTVVLDQDFSVGARVGASGTPSAVLVDARGNIASSLVVGAQAVLALAGAQPESPRTPA